MSTRDVIGHGEEQHRAHRGERAPEHLSRRRRRSLGKAVADHGLRLRGPFGDCRGSRLAEARPARGGAEHDEQRVRGRPAQGLRACRRPRLEQERISDEREHRCEIRQREQAIGARARTGAREPRLDQRARRRQQEVGQADRDGEQAQDQPRRVLVAGRLPAAAGNDGQRDQRDDEERDVQPHLRARSEPVHGEIRIRIAGEERRLEEDEARGPDGRRAAEPRENLLRHHGLDEEQQEGADEDRGGVEEHGKGPRRRGPADGESAHSTGSPRGGNDARTVTPVNGAPGALINRQCGA